MDDDIDATVGLLGMIEQLGDLGLVGDVCLKHRGSAAAVVIAVSASLAGAGLPA